MPTTVIHIKNAPAGWKKDPQYVYIGRGSMWGNPYPITKQMDRDAVCDCYEEKSLPALQDQIHQLKGKVLVCFCAPLRCHGHSLAAIAEEE